MSFDPTCLLSTLVNTSGQTMKFGELPPHGQELEADEEISVFGQITEAVNRGDRFGNRHMLALLSDLENGYLSIKSTPAPILYDESLDETQMLLLDDGTLAVAAPCWEVTV
jgi:hypothetical protein